jgi:YVTN family beta-propeller protein
MKTIQKLSHSRATILFVLALALYFSTGLTSCKKKDKDEPAPTPSVTDTKVVYVANEDGGSVSVINAVDGTVIKTVDLMDGSKMFMAHNVQVAPDGKSLWVTCVPAVAGDVEQVVVISTTTNAITNRINLGTEQHLAHVVLDANSTFAYVTGNESNQVVKINAQTFAEVSRFDLDTAHKPHGLRQLNGKLYVANMTAKSMSIIDIATSSINEIPLGGIAVQTAVTRDGKYAFASLYDTKEVAMYNILTQQVSKISLPSGSQGPLQLYPTPDSKFLYVCDQGGINGDPTSNKVFVIDITTSSVINTITVGNKAHGIVIDADGKMAYVTNTDDNTVSVIDIASQMVMKTIAVGDGPNGISFGYTTNGVAGGQP